MKHFIKGSDTLIFPRNLENQTENISAAPEIRIISENVYYLCYIVNNSRYHSVLWCSKEVCSSVYQIIRIKMKNVMLILIFIQIFTILRHFSGVIVTENYYFLLYFSPGNLRYRQGD